MIICVQDARLGEIALEPHRLPAGAKLERIVVHPATTVPAVVSTIRERAERIDLLILCAFGSPGWLQLGSGLGARQASYFRRLRSAMRSDVTRPSPVGVEVHCYSCLFPEAAESGELTSPGAQLLTALARAVDRPTRGALRRNSKLVWVTTHPNGDQIADTIESESESFEVIEERRPDSQRELPG